LYAFGGIPQVPREVYMSTDNRVREATAAMKSAAADSMKGRAEQALREASTAQASHTLLRSLEDERESAVDPLDEVVTSISSHLFADWLPANLSYMDELSTFGPGPDAAGSAVGGFQNPILRPGSATIRFDADCPDSEEWWLSMWGDSCVLPEAPFAGKAYFRFSTRMTSEVLNGAGERAMWGSVVQPWATSDIFADGPQSHGAPITRLLFQQLSPVEDHQYEQASSAWRDVVGSIDLTPGSRPAVLIVIGFNIGLRNASARVRAEAQVRMVTGPGVPDTQYQHGRLEYMYQPDWWIKAVSDKIDLQAAPI